MFRLSSQQADSEIERKRIFRGNKMKCFVLGCGSSLEGFNFQRLNDYHTIGTNNIMLDYPEVKTCLFSDPIFWQLWKDEITAFKGKILAHERAVPETERELPNLEIFCTNMRQPEKLEGHVLFGTLSGISALNYACWHYDEIYLLGFDLYGGHYHTNDDMYSCKPDIERLVNKFGLFPEAFPNHKIYNCSPQSLIRCFPFVNIDDIIK